MQSNNFSNKLELVRNNFLPKVEPVDHCNSTTPMTSNSTSTSCSHTREVGDKEICTGCNNPIEDKFLKRIMEDSWHETCLRCSACHGTLDGSCFLRDKQLLCRADYEKLFSVRCSGCGQIVFSQDLVMKVMNSNVYHVECFSCAVCRLPLQKGDHFVICESQVYCRADFEKKMSNPAYFFHQLSPAQHFMNEWYRLKSEDECSSMDELEGEQGKGPKRPRTILTTSQRKKFKSSFEVNPKPCRKVREALAAETGLSVRVVQVWFQNQRAKMKKLARRQSDEGQTKKLKPRKEDEDGSEKSSPPSEAAVSVLNADSIASQNVADSSINIFGHQELFASPGTDYGDLDHVAMKSGVTSSFILNPIDKLYSMQSSYFTVD